MVYDTTLNIPDKSAFKKEQKIKSTSYRVYDPMLGWKINSNGKQPHYIFQVHMVQEFQKVNIKWK